MNLIVQNASPNFAKALRQLAKIDGATVKTQRPHKNAVQIAIEQVARGETERYATLENFKKAMES